MPRRSRSCGAASWPARRTTSLPSLPTPDYVVNAGGVIQLVGLEDRGWGEAELERALAGIGDTLRRIYADASATGITPAEAAERLAAERIAQGRQEPVA